MTSVNYTIDKRVVRGSSVFFVVDEDDVDLYETRDINEAMFFIADINGFSDDSPEYVEHEDSPTLQ